MTERNGRAPRQAVARFSVTPRIELAIKCGAAAVLSWVIAGRITSALQLTEVDAYMYYAPLGAVVATNPTVVESVKVAWKAALALLVGAALGLTVSLLVDPSLLSLALVVGLGVACGALPGLGEQRSWVPVIALFVVLVGGAHPTTYAGAYVGLTALGATCGVAVNLLLPSIPFRQQQAAVHQLRTQLSDQLLELAAGLRGTPPPAWDGWEKGSRSTGAALERTRDTVRELMLAQRGNPRGYRHRTWVRQQAEVARSLERVALLVEDLVDMLDETDRRNPETSPLDPELAQVVAASLVQLAGLVRTYDTKTTDDDEAVRRVEECMHQLTDEFGRRRNLEVSDVALLGAVVANLRRSTAAVHPGRSGPLG
jgi:uncharacterized membrane protein YgaE (UPF0421/DUF939 family)